MSVAGGIEANVLGISLSVMFEAYL